MPKTEKEILLFISEKVEKLDEKIHSIDKTLSKNTVLLDEHMRRTELAEDKLDTFEERIGPALDAYKFVATCFKLCVGIATIVGIYYKWVK